MNDAWVKLCSSGEIYLYFLPSVGANYPEVFRKSAADEVDAARAIAGIEAVLAGDRTQFSMEYACPEVGAWFMMTAVPLPAAQSELPLSLIRILRCEKGQRKSFRMRTES